MVQLSHPYRTTGKTIALTVCSFVSKVTSLLFNMLSRFVTAFLPRSKCFFNFVAAVIIQSDFGNQENKICHCFHFSPIYLPWNDVTGCLDLSFLNVVFQGSFFFTSLSPSSRGCLVPFHLVPLKSGVVIIVTWMQTLSPPSLPTMS